MTDPNTTDGSGDDAPIRTWTRMNLPQRERPELPDGVDDPFGFFPSGDEEGR
ncbi:hypothetical protein OLG66_19800 [Mycobacterium senegalense]|uniref:hypothetical protein n=1 Tax=Mycolicibacterium senegalense TaxID=1796 RepID=UPI00222372F8|nr:hypothetical protein [Mycolicibacterium senegalense]MCW1823168.1 hypothetical protein [Mycolicibacterium senegalense]